MCPGAYLVSVPPHSDLQLRVVERLTINSELVFRINSLYY